MIQFAALKGVDNDKSQKTEGVDGSRLPLHAASLPSWQCGPETTPGCADPGREGAEGEGEEGENDTRGQDRRIGRREWEHESTNEPQ